MREKLLNQIKATPCYIAIKQCSVSFYVLSASDSTVVLVCHSYTLCTVDSGRHNEMLQCEIIQLYLQCKVS